MNEGESRMVLNREVPVRYRYKDTGGYAQEFAYKTALFFHAPDVLEHGVGACDREFFVVKRQCSSCRYGHVRNFWIRSFEVRSIAQSRSRYLLGVRVQTLQDVRSLRHGIGNTNVKNSVGRSGIAVAQKIGVYAIPRGYDDAFCQRGRGGHLIVFSVYRRGHGFEIVA